MTDAEIAGFMDWRGPGAYTVYKMRRVKRAIAEAVSREREACAVDCAINIRKRSNVQIEGQPASGLSRSNAGLEGETWR